MAALATWRCTFVAKKEVRDWPIVGWLAQSLGVVFVDRTRKRDLLRAIPALEEALRDGELVLLFPEGTTTAGDGVLRFRSALFEAAVRARAAIYPLAISGQATQRDVHNTPVVCWLGEETLVANIRRLFAARGLEFSLALGAPITDGDRKQLAARAHEHVVRQFAPVRTHALVPTPPHAPARAWSRTYIVTRALKRVATAFAAPTLALMIVISLGYAATPVYRFAEPRAFSGTSWYNPYDGLDGRSGAWRLANFHAHSEAWGGLTRGAQTSDSVTAAYRRLRYDVIGVSNYQSSPDNRVAGTFPVYEHGWNVRKAHQLVFNPAHVVWLDFPFVQTRDQQQYLLDQLSRSAPLVAIAHPEVRGARTPDDLRHLTHYDLLEVLNRYSAPADSEWDAALSTGHAAWLLASDDSHNSADTDQVGQNATRVYARSMSTGEVIEALRAGRAYGVHGVRGKTALSLRAVAMHGDTLRVSIDGDADTIRIVGEHGAVRAELRGVSARNATISAVASPDDGYLRVVAHGDSSLLYTNPVIRWDGHELPRVDVVIDWPRTIVWRAGWACAYAGMAWRLVAARRRARSAGVAVVA